jgi:predicted transcriptional regulator
MLTYKDLKQDRLVTIGLVLMLCKKEKSTIYKMMKVFGGGRYKFQSATKILTEKGFLKEVEINGAKEYVTTEKSDFLLNLFMELFAQLEIKDRILSEIALFTG